MYRVVYRIMALVSICVSYRWKVYRCSPSDNEQELVGNEIPVEPLEAKEDV